MCSDYFNLALIIAHLNLVLLTLHEGPTRTALFGISSISSSDVAGITTTCSGRRRVEPRTDSAAGSKKVREHGSSLCA